VTPQVPTEPYLSYGDRGAEDVSRQMA